MKNFEKGRIHPTALISEKAVLGDQVAVGAYTIIYDNVHLGSGAVVGPYCILGEPIANYYGRESYENPSLEIGAGALLRSGTIMYAGSTIGAQLETGHRATIREGSSIGHHVRIGTYSDVQGHCQIGDYVRLHSSVHIGQLSTIGSYVWIFPFTVLTNDPHPPSEDNAGVTIEDFAVIGAHAVLLPGIRVATNSVVGAGAVVYRDVPEAAVIAGNPARRMATIDGVKNRVTGEPAYPWPEHFDRGMPWEGIGFETWDLRRREGIA